MGFHGLVEETVKIVGWIADMGDKTLQKEWKQVAEALSKLNFAILKTLQLELPSNAYDQFISECKDPRTSDAPQILFLLGL